LSVAVGVAKYYLYTFIEKKRVTVNINWGISFCSVRGVRAKFFRVSALRPPLPCLRQFLFFSLAEFLKFSALDRFFSWGFAPIFYFFLRFLKFSEPFSFTLFLPPSPYLSWLYYTPFLLSCQHFLLNLFSFLCCFIIFLCCYII